MKNYNLVGMLPFLKNEELELLAKKIMESEEDSYKGVRIAMVLPFLKKAVVDKLFLQRVREGKKYRSFLPFVSNAGLHEFAVKYVKDELDIDLDMNELYPFMEDDDIRMIFRHELEKE